jgi:hypothetical protein
LVSTRALAPSMNDEEWREAVSDDWRDDLRGHSAMSMPLYLMSIFEVADLWTDSVEEWQYVVFINKLFRGPWHAREPATARVFWLLARCAGAAEALRRR